MQLGRSIRSPVRAFRALCWADGMRPRPSSASPGVAAAQYLKALDARHGAFFPTTAALQAYMASHPRMFSLTGKVLTAPGISSFLGGAWSMYWNDLMDGASPGATQAAAKTIGAFAQLVTTRSSLRRSTERHIVGETGAAPSAPYVDHLFDRQRTDQAVRDVMSI